MSSTNKESNTPGNTCLKDQRMAMVWIKDNAESFGGDANNITLMGCGTGAISVHYHMLSSFSEDLFHKAILMSGSALSSCSVQDQKTKLTELAMRMDFYGSSKHYEFFKICTGERINKAQQKLTLKLHERFPFAPIDEEYKDKAGNIAFGTPFQLFQTAWGHRIPVIMGTVAHEGFAIYHSLHTEFRRHLEDPDYMRHLVAAEFKLDVESTRCIRIAKALQNYYFTNKTPTIYQLLDFIADKLFLHGIHRHIFGRIKKNQAPTYLYRFSYDSDYFSYYRNLYCGHFQRGETIKYLYYILNLIYF